MAKRISEAEFKVDLGQLNDAIGSVRGKSSDIKDSLASISGLFGAIEAAWNSPSGTSFEDMEKWFTNVASDVHALLDDMVQRMKTSYDNYRNTESANYRNLLTGNLGHSGSRGGNGHGGNGHGGERRQRERLEGEPRSDGDGTLKRMSGGTPLSNQSEALKRVTVGTPLEN